jgi:hypothetical protein
VWLGSLPPSSSFAQIGSRVCTMLSMTPEEIA